MALGVKKPDWTGLPNTIKELKWKISKDKGNKSVRHLTYFKTDLLTSGFTLDEPGSFASIAWLPLALTLMRRRKRKLLLMLMLPERRYHLPRVRLYLCHGRD